MNPSKELPLLGFWQEICVARNDAEGQEKDSFIEQVEVGDLPVDMWFDADEVAKPEDLKVQREVCSHAPYLKPHYVDEGQASQTKESIEKDAVLILIIENLIQIPEHFLKAFLVQLCGVNQQGELENCRQS